MEVFYVKEVNLSLAFTQRLGYWAHNCKMVYSLKYKKKVKSLQML